MFDLGRVEQSARGDASEESRSEDLEKRWEFDRVAVRRGEKNDGSIRRSAV